MEAAVSGQGVALARPTLARHWLATGTLQPLFTLTVPAANPYHLVLHRPDGAAVVFADWLRGVCRQAEATSAAWLSGLA